MNNTSAALSVFSLLENVRREYVVLRDDVGGRARVTRDAWRATAARRLNSDEIMQIWRLGDCEDFVSEWEEFAFDAFGYFEPVKRA